MAKKHKNKQSYPNIRKEELREKNRKKEKIPLLAHLIIAAEIAVMVIIFLLYALGIKGAVEWINMNTLRYRTWGTVTTADYQGRYTRYEDGVSRDYYKYVHCVITFDQEVGGHTKYEYEGHDVTCIRRSVNERYYLGFNKYERYVHIYDPEDWIIDRVILLIDVIMTILVIVFRKKLWKMIKNIAEKLDMLFL